MQVAYEINKSVEVDQFTDLLHSGWNGAADQ